LDVGAWRLNGDALKKLIFSLLALPVVLVILFLATQMRWKWSRPVARPDAAPAGMVSNRSVIFSPSAPLPSGGGHELLGATILRDYANTNLPPENDLTLMSRLMENSLLLLKAAANRPLSANEDWADMFRGKNAAREEFLPAQHVALNAQGQLVDRWQTPLFFHALGAGRYEIRSAGPDRQMWTADDLQRNANGTFLHASNAPAPPPR